MLNRILFLFLGLLLLSCQSATEVGADAQASTSPSKATAVQTAARDTLPKVQPAQSRIMADRSRRLEEIDTKFPFDIPLQDADLKVMASNQVIPDNGKPTVVLFWLTTCYPCRIEMKAIQEKYEQWTAAEEFNIVAISTDWDRNLEQFSKMARSEGWPWQAYRDRDREFRKILPGGLNGLPQTFIFDGKGEIVYHSRKYRSGDEDKLFAAIQKANKS